MAFNDFIDRPNDAGVLEPDETLFSIFDAVAEQSAVMRLGRRLPNLSTSKESLHVTDGLPVAYFVGATTAQSGDKGRIQTSEMTWDDVVLRAAKLGVIIPVPKDVFNDVDRNLWAEIQPKLVQAFGKAFDQAVLYGTNAPTDWPNSGAGLLDLITNASQTVDYSTQLAAGVDLYDMELGQLPDASNGVVGLVEETGYMVNGHVMSVNMRGRLRGTRDSVGNPVFSKEPRSFPVGAFDYTLDGEPVLFPRNGAIDATQALDIAGDWTQLVYAMRDGLSFEVLDQASIYNDSGTLQFALAQDDMIALKATMRLGWQLPRPIHPVGGATPVPFAALVP